MNSLASSAPSLDTPGESISRRVRATLVALPFVWPVVGGPSVNAWQAFASLWCVALLMLFGPTQRVDARPLCILAFTAAVIVLRGPDVGLWLPAVVALAAIGLGAACGAGMAKDGVAVLACGLLGAGLVSGVLGLVQYYGFAHLFAPWTTSPELGQAYGNLRQRNQFATLMSMALVSALWLYASFGASTVRRWLVAAAVLLLLGSAASTSRTGLLQLLSVIGVAAYAAQRERRSGASQRRLPPPLVLLSMIPLYFALAWLLPLLTSTGAVEGMLQRLREGAPSDHSRVILWRNVLTLIAAHPWEGWGWGELSFGHFSTLYEGPRFVEILDNAHCLPLHLAAELGIPAAVTICGGFLLIVLQARPWRERDPSRLMAWGVLGAIMLHSMLEYPLWYGPFQLVFGLCLGVLWPSSRAARASPRRVRPDIALAVALIAMVGYANWDYIRVSQIYLPRNERLPAYQEDTLAKLQHSWLFANQVRFAELTLTTVTQSNAEAVHATAERTLHFSPEPRVIVKLIESAQLLRRNAEARAQADRFRIAFPVEFTHWLAERPDGSQQAP